MNNKEKNTGTSIPATVHHHPQRPNPRLPFNNTNPVTATKIKITAIASLTHFHTVPKVARCNLFISKYGSTLKVSHDTFSGFRIYNNLAIFNKNF